MLHHLFRQILVEKLELKSWDEYQKLVADAYLQAPKYDRAAVGAWQALNASNHKLFQRLLSRANIIFVTEDQNYAGERLNINGRQYIVQYGKDPYESQAQMKADWEKTGSLKISVDHSQHPVFSVEDNIVFRSVHDFIVHILGNHPFGVKGEIASYNLHAKLVPREAVPAIFTEVVGQACVAVEYGDFPEQKIAILKGFDYYNVGRVEGYNVQNKQLVQKPKPQTNPDGSMVKKIQQPQQEPELVAEAPITQYRDKTHYRGANIKYPDNIFAQIQTPEQANVALNFYKKIVAVFNNLFDRKYTVKRAEVTNDKSGVNFVVVITNERGLEPEYYAYPTATMGQHVVQRYIDKFVPGTSLRHELLHETIKPYITEKFELINHLDQSAEGSDIESVQRQRAFNYSLEDVFYERVVENLERLPDYKDTFPVADFAKDAVARIKKGLQGEITAQSVMARLKQVLQDEDNTQNRWLISTLYTIFRGIDYSRITDLDQVIPQVGKQFENRFNAQKNIFAQELQYKIYQFTQRFMDEYLGAVTRIQKVKTPLTESIAMIFVGGLMVHYLISLFQRLKKKEDESMHGKLLPSTAFALTIDQMLDGLKSGTVKITQLPDRYKIITSDGEDVDIRKDGVMILGNIQLQLTDKDISRFETIFKGSGAQAL